MTLLDTAFSDDSLLAGYWLTWTRTRTTQTGRDATTGAPTVTTSTATIQGQLTWMRQAEAANYQNDATAYILTLPGQLQEGDTITNADVGTFQVLEDGARSNGPFDRANLKAA